MKNTRENVITLLKQMADNAYAVSEIFRKQDNNVMDEKCMGQYTAYDNAVRLLKDKKYFDTIWKIYNEEAEQ